MTYSEAKILARKLRKNQTPAEQKFWGNCRNRRLFRLKFNRQYLISYRLNDSKSNYFIADFYCHAFKLIVEIDGKIHLKRKEYDRERSLILKGLGFSILRFTNDQVENDWDMVENRIGKLVFNSQRRV